MEGKNQSEEDEDELNEVISMRSEASILQKASEEIKRLVGSSSKNEGLVLEGKLPKELTENAKSVDDNSVLRARLQDQVRTGEITPFQAAKKENDSKKAAGRILKESTELLDLEKYLMQQAKLAKEKKLAKLKKNKASKNEKEKDAVPAKKMKMTETKTQTFGKKKSQSQSKSSKQILKKSETITSQPKSITTLADLGNNLEKDENSSDYDINHMECSTETSNTLMHEQISKVKKTFNVEECEGESGSEYLPSDDYDSEENIKKIQRKRKKNYLKPSSSKTKRVLDDGDEDIYVERVRGSGYKVNEPLHKIDNVFKIPLRIWKHLYKYQRVAVKWLWELHTRNLGGLLGDEMGLGKTVQVIAFLAGLDCSELLSDGGRFRGLGPTLIVCPATLLEQWVQHFHDWWPTLRVVMLHQSSSFHGDVTELLRSLKGGGILTITYTGLLIHKESILNYKWHYVILDEGHKIRNPDAKVSKAVKRVLTPHRLLLTGSPMQNSLKELWSLFDFILPGKLGTLPAFMEHCVSPITRGGYANASHLQEATALQVATMLKNAITPYMLRRTKYDVQHHVNLPDKNEQVLFCSLTEEQRQLYKNFLRSDEVSFVLHERREGGRYRARLLVALTALRKICNHPDLFLYTGTQEESDEDEEIEIDDNEIDQFGHWKRAGKMTVVRSLLKIWKKQGHRVLLFTQSRQMMHILEGLVQKEKYEYLRMDGTTPMNQRQLTISKFNKDPTFFVFLLTTRVGGLGVNLTGANRVIIYDPDWNPATDAQARERAWRIGQEKNVTVYRLITAGTIEEKMYHRQVYKILLSNRVLEDPRQRRLFKTTDLTELFNLNEPISGGSSESDQLFRDSKLSSNNPSFTASKVEEMKRLASTLSKIIGEKSKDNRSTVNEDEDRIQSIETGEESQIRSNTPDDQMMGDEISAKKNADDDTESIDNHDNVKMPDNSIHKNTEVIEENVGIEIPTRINDEEWNVEVPSRKDHSKTLKTDHNELEEGEIIDVSPKLKEKATKKKDKNLLRRSNKTEEVKNHKSHKKHKKHKKTESKDISAIFEGERVSCLIGRRLGKPHEPNPVANSDDQYVLSKLFSKAAVSSAFQHESILSNAVLNPEEETPLQRAAKGTASEKMEQIRQSRRWCWKPCWDNPPEEDYIDGESDEDNVSDENDDENDRCE